MKYPRETKNYTDRRQFRNDLDSYLNAGVRLVVLCDMERGKMRIILLEEKCKPES